MATARKLPSGSWRVQVYAGKKDGKNQYKSFTAETKKEAEFLAVSYMMDHQPQVSSSTFEVALKKYLDSKSNVLSPSTLCAYKKIAKNNLSPLQKKRVCDITQEDIQTTINALAKSHAPKTIRNIHGLLSAVLSAYRPGLKLQTTLPQKIKPEIYVPSDADIKLLINAADHPDLKKAILLAAFGSLRRSEIAALRTSDFDGTVLTVSRAVVLNDAGEWVEKPPKSFAGYRKIDLPQKVVDIVTSGAGKGEIIAMKPNMITKRFVQLRETVGIEKIRFHDLRHYQASILHALGVPDLYIMERGGWKTRGTLDCVYKHTMDAKTKSISQVANKHFSKIISHEISHEIKKVE